jgi:hypothetical protein
MRSHTKVTILPASELALAHPILSHDRSVTVIVSALLFGSFRTSVDLRTIGEDRWQRKKAAGLVKLLALASSHQMHCDQVIDLLWPHLGGQAAANNLHRPLYVARRTLEPDLLTASWYLTLRPSSKELRQPLDVPGIRRPTGRLSTYTPVSCCRKTATRNRRNPTASACQGCNYRCSSSWRESTRLATSPPVQVSRRSAERLAARLSRQGGARGSDGLVCLLQAQGGDYESEYQRLQEALSASSQKNPAWLLGVSGRRS